MHKFLHYLRPLILWNVRHPYRVLGIAFLVGVVAASFALQLKIDTDIANLLPPDNPRVIALNQLRETVGGETEMDVAIGSPDFEANKRFAEDLIVKSLELYDRRSQSPYFSKVEFRKDTEVLKDYALFLATEEELDELIVYLDDEIENAKLEANPFFIDFGDDEDYEDEEDAGKRFEDVYKELIPSEYPVNADSTVLTLKLFPTGAKSDLAFLRRMFANYDSLVVAMNPASYHPEMQVKFGGRLKKHLLEIDSIMNDVFSSFSTGIGSVLLLVMFYFLGKKYVNYRRGSIDDRRKGFFSFFIRAPVSILVIGIPLFLSLVYTFGLTYLYLGGLNTMTSVLFVILFGLGIDYGIHFYARYLEMRSDGLDVEKAILATYESSGAAIFTAATTTAVALFVLTFADFRGFSEFGFIATVGIMLAWFAMSFILPAIVTLFERFGWILVNRNVVDENAVVVTKRYPFAMPITIFGFVVMFLVIVFSGRISFEYDFGKLEPEFPEYKAYQQFTSSGGTGTSRSRRNPAYIIAENDEQVIEILDEIRTIKETNGEESTILDVEALQERFSDDPDVQSAKFDRIATIREQLEDPFISGQDDENLDILRRASKVTKPIDLDEIPDFLKNRFMTRDGELGKFVMIYPSVGLSDGRNSIAFKNEIGLITTSDGREFHSGSTSIAAAEMLELMQDESPYFVTGTFVMIVLIVLFSFRSLRWSLIAMLPLIVGLSWTFGIMILFDIKFNFYNLVVLPAILGIGNDNGVHLATRYLEEGPKSMWNVLKSTGQHISIGSITTMFGFMGLLLTNHPGLYSIGLLATIGVGMTLLSALTFLPALIQVLEDRGWIHFIARHKDEN